MELVHGALVTPRREAYLSYMARAARSTALTGKFKNKYCEGFGFVFILQIFNHNIKYCI